MCIYSSVGACGAFVPGGVTHVGIRWYIGILVACVSRQSISLLLSSLD